MSQQVGSRLWTPSRYPLVLEQECGAFVASPTGFIDKILLLVPPNGYVGAYSPCKSQAFSLVV